MPKTIDNDLPLPDNAPTFGFETARSVGAGILESLMEDARTTARWYVVVCMGRKSGSLALGMCKAAGSTLAVLPEEFPGETHRARGGRRHDRRRDRQAPLVRREHGVAVVAEGIAERTRRESPRSRTSDATRSGTSRWPTFRSVHVLRDGVRQR